MQLNLSRGAPAAGRSPPCVALLRPYVALTELHPAPLFNQHRNVSAQSASVADRVTVAEPKTAANPQTAVELNQYIREGHYESSLVQLQATKPDPDQTSIASVLPVPPNQQLADVVVVGAGPSGLYLAAELGRRGLTVTVIGRDLPVTNNYGVWTDEFEALGLMHTVECSWPDAVCFFGEGNMVSVKRGYSRVHRRKLRDHLLGLCKEARVSFLNAEVEDIAVVEEGKLSAVTTSDGAVFRARMVTLAAGAAGGRFLRYEEGAPIVAAQTAYGIEAEVEGYDEAYPKDLMTFMDFRRHHTGLYDGTARHLEAGKHPNSGDGMWGCGEEAPSFLYAMPLGGKRVFLEETCLVAKPALPFAVLKRRLDRRLRAMGIRVTKVHEEEWSYIPVGGPMPVQEQTVTAFGAAANLVHPATGFSISRSFREAPAMADQIESVLKEALSIEEASKKVWDALWPQEKRTQAAFQVFGMELLATLDLPATNNFFNTFFRLPTSYWRGFLGSRLSAGELISFALVTFVLAPFDIKYKLMEHLFKDPAGMYLVRAYYALWGGDKEEGDQAATATSTAAAVAGVALTSALVSQLVISGAALASQSQ